jgi:hypothetical protein
MKKLEKNFYFYFFSFFRFILIFRFFIKINFTRKTKLILLRLPYAHFFGGAGALAGDLWLRVNGFSNDYWGWGGEVFQS